MFERLRSYVMQAAIDLPKAFSMRDDRETSAHSRPDGTDESKPLGRSSGDGDAR